MPASSHKDTSAKDAAFCGAGAACSCQQRCKNTHCVALPYGQGAVSVCHTPHLARLYVYSKLHSIGPA